MKHNKRKQKIWKCVGTYLYIYSSTIQHQTIYSNKPKRQSKLTHVIFYNKIYRTILYQTDDLPLANFVIISWWILVPIVVTFFEFFNSLRTCVWSREQRKHSLDLCLISSLPTDYPSSLLYKQTGQQPCFE